VSIAPSEALPSLHIDGMISLAGSCKLRVNGTACSVEILVEKDVPVAIPTDEELCVLKVLDPVHIPGRCEEKISVHQVVAFLLGEVPNLLLALDDHQVVAKGVVVRWLHTASLEADVRRGGALPHDPHLAARHNPHRLELHPVPETADGADRVRGTLRLRDGGHLVWRGVEEPLDVLRPGRVAGGGARGAEGRGEPGIGYGGRGVGLRGDSGESEDVAGVDGACVDGVGGGSAVGGVDARVLVGEDADAGAGAADYDAADLGGVRLRVGRGDVSGDGCGGGVVLVDAEVNDLGDGGVGAEISDDGVLEWLAEAIGGCKDLEAAIGGHGG
jgi:hypothetical protein